MSATAIATVRSLSIELTLHPAPTPTILADRSNLVLHLHPHPLVARVAMATSLVRVGIQWLRREIDISRHLDAAGALVTRPSVRIDAGPYERDSLVISFWELETVVPELIDPHAAGAGLAHAHRCLATYPRDELPLWGGVTEAREVYARGRANASFDPHELAQLDAAWEKVDTIVESAPRRSASFQAVHGDAHINNVLPTPRGALWTDWEDAFVGPIEWDIACLRSRAELFGEERDVIDAMTRAYDGDYDVDLARELGLVRNVQVICWLAVFAERQPELLPRMRARIERLP